MRWPTTRFSTDGWRQHSRGSYDQFNANVGYRISDTVETRFYAGVYGTRQLLPGSLTLGQALNTPRMANPAALSGNQARNINTERFANRTTVRLDAGQLDLDSWVDPQVALPPDLPGDRPGRPTWGLAPRWTQAFTVGGLRDDLVVGGRYFAGSNDAAAICQHRAARAARRPPTACSGPRTTRPSCENRLWVLPQVALVAGAKALRDDRDYENRLTPASAFTHRTYDGLNPKIGVLWQPRPEVQVFGNITRSQDVPDFSDQCRR